MSNENVGGFQREIARTLRVSQKNELLQIVEEANRNKTPLYPFSRGFNWGYGSHLPVKNGGVIVDLSALDRILHIDEEQGIATVEPGVTQKQLADELLRRGSRYYLDVTGSGAETSILGNALERGIAYGSLRAQQLTGMEVLLGNGKLIRTGFGGFPKTTLDGLYSYGLGPDVSGLFFQSSFGIVLEGKIQLTLRPEGMTGLSIAVKSEHMQVFVDKLAGLLRQGSLSGIPHLADRERSVSTIAPLVARKTGMTAAEAHEITRSVIKEDWMLTASVTGAPDVVAAKLKVIKKSLGSLGTIYSHELLRASFKDRLKARILNLVLTPQQKVVISAAETLRGFHKGVPSNAGIQFLSDKGNGTVDESTEGFLLCTPLAPLCGSSAQIFARIAQEEAQRHQVRFAMTLNALTGRVLEAVISAHFLKASREERDRAHAFVNSMTARFSEQGFYPYRINIDQQVHPFGTSSQMSETLKAIKAVLDPNGIIAPGRYGS